MTDIWLDEPVTTTAYGWRLDRTDGVALGFTSHDRDLLLDGIVLRASPGMVPGAVVESLGMESGGLDVKGALTSNAIRHDDLRAGRWNGAWLEIFLFDWTNPDGGKRLLASGELGAVSMSGDAFEAEFLGIAQALDRPVVPATSPGCRARFCGSECGLSQRRFTHHARVEAAEEEALLLDAAFPAGRLTLGTLRWLDGANCGLLADIVGDAGDELSLSDAPAFPVEPGARIELVDGCDHRFETCRDRFANAHNFRGEPYLPGNDLLTRYPGA